MYLLKGHGHSQNSCVKLCMNSSSRMIGVRYIAARPERQGNPPSIRTPALQSKFRRAMYWYPRNLQKFQEPSRLTLWPVPTPPILPLSNGANIHRIVRSGSETSSSAKRMNFVETFGMARHIWIRLFWTGLRSTLIRLEMELANLVTSFNFSSVVTI